MTTDKDRERAREIVERMDVRFDGDSVSIRVEQRRSVGNLIAAALAAERERAAVAAAGIDSLAECPSCCVDLANEIAAAIREGSDG